MPSKHQKTLAAIFAKPTRANIHYRDVEAMLVWLGAEVVVSRSGSRVFLELNGEGHSYHRPHPGKELSRETVRDLRDFLSSAGMEP